MKYRKKPVEVDVIEIKRDYKNLDKLRSFTDKNLVRIDHQIRLKTAEGIMTARPGYWIIKGIDPRGGYRFWCVDPEYFAETYEKVEEI